MNLVIGSDMAGYGLKSLMKEKLASWGHEIIDVGSRSPDDDMVFPDVARLLCSHMLDGSAQRGIMFCGTGVGAAIACNKIPGMRASVVHDVQTAHQCVEHDDVQIMCIGEKIVGEWLAEDLLREFLNTEYVANERYDLMVKTLCELDGSL